MADEYLITVGIGILALALLLLITNAQFIGIFGGAPAAKPAPQLLTASFDMGEVKASFIKETKVHELGSKEASSGIFFGESAVRYHFDAPEIESASVKFRVVRANDLGPLFVRYNGQLVEEKQYAVGDYTVNIPKEMLNESSTIELSAASSLWQIWAPNIYTLRNIAITAKSFALEPEEISFGLGEEFAGFKEGRLELDMEDNTGRLSVVLNEKEIFSGRVRNQDSIRINKTDVRAGTNIIRIVPAQGSRFLGTGRVVVFYEK